MVRADAVRALGASVHVFSSMHVSGEQLANFSGVAAVLRFPCTLEQLLGANHHGYDDEEEDVEGEEDEEDEPVGLAVQ